MFVPSWLDGEAQGRDLGPGFAPKSAFRIGVDSLHDIGSVLSWRTPPEWWWSDAAKNWLFDLARLDWQDMTLSVWVGGERDPEIQDWLEAHPPPPPIDRDTLEKVLNEELADLEDWLAATDVEPDFDGRHGWSYWVVGKRRVVRVVVVTPCRVIGYASMRVPRALPVHFTLRLMPGRRQIRDGDDGMLLEIPIDAGVPLSLRLSFPLEHRRIRGWAIPQRGKTLNRRGSTSNADGFLHRDFG
jgi:hypothetical protein